MLRLNFMTKALALQRNIKNNLKITIFLIFNDIYNRNNLIGTRKYGNTNTT